MFVKNNTILLSEHHARLSQFIEELPSHFDKNGLLIRQQRNTVKIFEHDSLLINAKEFCAPPIFYNRIAYCFIRRPKAVKAYQNALRLKEFGIETHTPIAYMLFKKRYLLSKCYFISEQYAHTHSITDYEKAPLDDKLAAQLTEFGYFTARLHNLGILHGDYGNGNILINYKEDKPIFSLIDINRMSFGEVSFKGGCKEFNRLNFTPEKFRIVARAYALARGFDPAQVETNILKYHRDFERKRRIKREKLYKIKRIFIPNSKK